MNNLKAWLQLLRLPNIFTVPGDVLMGAFLLHQAGHAFNPQPLAYTIFATGLFYLGGLVLNDLMDLREDAIERPDRPLPAQDISKRQAMIACGLMFGGGLGLCLLAGKPVFITGSCLLGFILLYDLGLKNVRVLGPATMGLCRASAIIMGAAACGDSFRLTWSGFALAETHLLYFAMVTILARYETRTTTPRPITLMPGIILLIGLLILLTINPHAHRLDIILYTLLSCIALLLNLETSRKVFETRKVEPRQIGQLIHLILWVQAAVICYAGQWPIALIILAFIPVSHWMRRYIYAS